LFERNRLPMMGKSFRSGTPLRTVPSFVRMSPPITAVWPSSTITRVSASLVLMMTPPWTVLCDERSLTSGCRSMMIRLSCVRRDLELDPDRLQLGDRVPRDVLDDEGDLLAHEDLGLAVVHRRDPGFEMMLALRFCSSTCSWASTKPQLFEIP